MDKSDWNAIKREELLALYRKMTVRMVMLHGSLELQKDRLHTKEKSWAFREQQLCFKDL